MQVLFGIREFGQGLRWSAMQDLIPDWSIATTDRHSLADAIDGVDVLVPAGAPVGADLIKRGRFGLIQQYGVGVENIDIDAATDAGVWVCRLPSHLTGNAESVAELAVADVLTAIRRLDEARAVLRDQTGWNTPAGRSLVGTTTALIGLGAIGTAVSKRLAGFGTRLVAVRATPGSGGPPEVDRVVGPGSLPDVLAEADVVICSVMASPETHHLFDRAAFAACKPGVIFVNVARGSVVDDTALLDALKSGQVAAAGLDVHTHEPVDPDSPLLRHPNVIATPHIGGTTTVMFDRSNELLATNLTRWCRGDEPMFAVNQPAHPR